MSARAKLGSQMMRRLSIALLGSLLMVSSAQAFQKTGSGEARAVPQTGPGALELSEEKAAGSKDDGGVVRIPGLGSLGVLPKLDFGLELLYGDNQEPSVAPQEEDDDSDGLRIRGTLKHRF